MFYYRKRIGSPLVGIVVGLLAVVMIVHAIIAAVVTLGIIVGVAGGVALAFPVVRRMLAQRRPLERIGTALVRIARR